MNILLTGGLGYIGSHTAVELLKSGNNVIIVDNLSNSDRSVLNAIKKLTKTDVKFYKYDLRKETGLNKIFSENKIDAVIHFAGLKAVGESVEKPLEYYENNLESTINLLKAMRKSGVKNLVFSSSATVYGKAKSMPIYEDFPTSATNPYGRTKLFIEEILKDVSIADPSLNIAILRYFNPVGAHESGLLGENPRGIPNNLMPYISQVSVGQLKELNIFGNDYNTKDGTGVRDYIHVVDLAKGHLAALDKLKTRCGLVVYNLGTGVGYSVLDMVNAFNKCCGGKVRYKFAPRRAGDVDECFASPEKAYNELGWKATKSLDDMCESTYNYQLKQLNKAYKHKA